MQPRWRRYLPVFGPDVGAREAFQRVVRDLGLALRGFRRTPAFAATAVLILATGIGMATSMFAVYNAVVLGALPVQAQDRIVLPRAIDQGGTELASWPEALEQLARQSRTMSIIGGVAHWGALASPMTDGDRTLSLRLARVTGNFFDVLGAHAVLGRLLRPTDDVAGAPKVVVLSYATWQRHFAGDPHVVGRRLATPYDATWTNTVVGVAPAGLDYPSGVEVWSPTKPYGRALMSAVARLATGASPGDARSEFLAFTRQTSPDLNLLTGRARGEVRTLPQEIEGGVHPSLAILSAAVALLLIIACVNVGNLLLLRASSRQREMAIRRALGASYREIARQLLIESAVLAAAGGLLGFACAAGLIRLLLALAPRELPRADVIQLSRMPVAIAVAVTCLAVGIFGVLPSLVAARGSHGVALRLDTRGGVETRSRRRLRQALVASQIALAMIMLSGAGLLARSLERLQHIDLGYSGDRLAFMTVTIPYDTYSTPAALNAMLGQIPERLRAIPGIRSSTPVLFAPFQAPNMFLAKIEAEGHALADAASSPIVPIEIGGPDYFTTLGVPLLRGRRFLDDDRESSPKVAVVSEALARRLWPNEDPVGKRYRSVFDTIAGAWTTVVGVAGDIRFRKLRDPSPTLYVPWRQYVPNGNFAIRTAVDFTSVRPAIDRALHEIDPRLRVWLAQTSTEVLAVPLAQPRLETLLLSAFGLVALTLAALGLYGVMSAIVRDQTRELGVRMALGASPARLRREVLARAARVTMLGAGAGLVVALLTTRALKALLYEVSATDPITLGAACVVLVGVSLVAAYLPARRATRIDPALALRAD